MKLETVLFDLDGTLIDHFEAIHRCINYAELQLGLELSSYDMVRATVGGSIIVTMQRLVGHERSEEAVRHFRRQFDEVWREGLYILPGARWLLSSLKQSGYRTVVFTNKAGDSARAIIEHLNLSSLLDDVCGTLDTPWYKPQVEFTNWVLERNGATPQTAVLVGDSPFDAATGAAVGMPVYLVATGSHTLDQLKTEENRGAFVDLFDLGRSVFNFQVDEVEKSVASAS